MSRTMRQLTARNFPEPDYSSSRIFIFAEDEAMIAASINQVLDRLPLEKLCDKNGAFPDRVVVNAAGRVSREEDTRSKASPISFKSYIYGKFDISVLNPEQKKWADDAIKKHLSKISRQVKKANNPPKPRKKPEKKQLSDEERRQKKFERILKMVEKAKQENNSPTR